MASFSTGTANVIALTLCSPGFYCFATVISTQDYGGTPLSEHLQQELFRNSLKCGMWVSLIYFGSEV